MEFIEQIIGTTAPGVACVGVVAYLAVKMIDRTCTSFEKALDKRDSDYDRLVDSMSHIIKKE